MTTQDSINMTTDTINMTTDTINMTTDTINMTTDTINMTTVVSLMAGNFTTEQSAEIPPPPTSTRQVLGKYTEESLLLAEVGACVILVLGVVGNSLTVAALVAPARDLRSSATRPFVVSLCCSDLAFCITVLPLLLVRYFTHQWALWNNPLLCTLYPFFMYGTIANSLFNLVWITISQYVAVVHPERGGQVFTRGVSGVLIALGWLTPYLILSFPLGGVWGGIGYDSERYTCTFLGETGRFFRLILHVVGFLTPCAIIVACYIKIFIVYHGSRSRVVSHVGRAAAAHEIRLAATMCVTFAAFVTTFLPFVATSLTGSLVSVTHPVAYVVASIFVWSHACLNPIIYVLFNRQFRSAYFAFFKTSRRRLRMLPSPRLSQPPINQHGYEARRQAARPPAGRGGRGDHGGRVNIAMDARESDDDDDTEYY